MGETYCIHRLPLDLAADLLCLRRRFQDIDHESFLGPYQSYTAPLQNEVPRTIDFFSGKSHVDLAMLVGPDFEGWKDGVWTWHRNEEADDVNVWAARGARLVGWHVLDLPVIPGATTFPYRYSLPTESHAIHEVIQDLTASDLRKNLRQCMERDLVARLPLPREKMLKRVPVVLLPTLRAFYTEAIAAREVVIYNLR